jgi:hypothetical protein
MTTTVDNTFITSWQTEWSMAYQQTDNKVRKYIKNIGDVANTFSVPTISASSGQRNRPRNQNITPANTQMNRVNWNMQVVSWGDYIHDFDQVRTNVNIREGFTKTAAAFFAREIDDIIIEAWTNAAALSQIAPVAVSNTLNQAGVALISAALSNNEVPDEERYGIISEGGMVDLTTVTAFTSRDFVPSSNAMARGFLEGIYGFDMQRFRRLPVPASNQRRCFFGHKMSTYFAVASEPSLKVDYVPEKRAWFVSMEGVFGAAVVQPNGVVYADILD